jgi:hypothetical protein
MRKLKVTQSLDGDPHVYIAPGESGPSERFIAAVAVGTKITVSRVDEYRHPVNGVFYDPIIAVMIDGTQYLAKGWHLFSMDTSKEIQPVPVIIKPCTNLVP